VLVVVVVFGHTIPDAVEADGDVDDVDASYITTNIRIFYIIFCL
jgi:hypothetical protein